MADFSIQEIVPGIHAVFGGVCNRGIINSGGHFLVVDSGINGAEATLLRAYVDKQRKDGSLSLFNTHPHLDHVFGNQLFADVPIIAQHNVRENMRTTGAQTLAFMKQNPERAAVMSDVVITLPTVIFQDNLTLYLGETEVQLIHFGTAHSSSDAVAWLPRTRTLFTGDLLFTDMVPAMPPGGDATNWIRALEGLEKLGAEHVVSGHGPLQTPEALVTLRIWLEELQKHVAAAIESGLDRDTAIARIPAKMQAVQPRAREERFPTAVGSVYDQLTQKHIQ